MKKIWFKLRDTWSIIGTKRFIPTASNWAFAKEFNVYRLDLSNFNAMDSDGINMRLTEMREVDIPLVLGINPGLTREKIQARLKGGLRCQLAWLGDEPVMCTWYGREVVPLEFLGLEMRLMPGDIAFVDAYVVKRMRKRGVYQAAVRRSAAHCKSLGFKRRFAFAASWHYPTNHMVRDILKYELVGGVAYRPLMPFNKYKLNGAIELDNSGRLLVPPSGSNHGANPRIS